MFQVFAHITILQYIELEGAFINNESKQYTIYIPGRLSCALGAKQLVVENMQTMLSAPNSFTFALDKENRRNNSLRLL